MAENLFSSEGPTLLEHSIDALNHESGLSPEIIRERGYRSILGKKELAEAGYGDQPPFLEGLEIRGLPYLVGVASSTRFGLAQDVEEDSGEQPAPPYQGQGRPRRARRLEDRIPSREANALLEELLQDAWQAIT